jgi:excisionase family DNA binding protein
MYNRANTFTDAIALEQLLTPQEVSLILRTSKSFTYKLMQSGALPVIHLGKSCRVRRRDLIEFIENNLHHNGDVR